MTARNWTIIAVLAVALVGVAAYSYQKKEEGVFCTMEAKLCPDGSSVGRTGPRCEFAECPRVDPYAGWETFRDSAKAIAFQYPESFDTKYIDPMDWPPQIQISPDPFTCTEAGSPGARAGRTERRTVDGREYCVTEVREGAAGSVYSQYAYVLPFEGKTAIFTFSVRAPQCGNYGEPEKTECEQELQAFNLDGLLDKIASSLRSE